MQLWAAFGAPTWATGPRSGGGPRPAWLIKPTHTSVWLTVTAHVDLSPAANQTTRSVGGSESSPSVLPPQHRAVWLASSTHVCDCPAEIATTWPAAAANEMSPGTRVRSFAGLPQQRTVLAMVSAHVCQPPDETDKTGPISVGTRRRPSEEAIPKQATLRLVAMITQVCHPPADTPTMSPMADGTDNWLSALDPKQAKRPIATAVRVSIDRTGNVARGKPQRSQHVAHGYER